MRLSIKKQLLTLFMPLLLALWIAGAFSCYLLVSSFSDDLFDRDLINSADSVVARLRVKDNTVSVDLPPAALAILKRDLSDKIYYRVLTSDGKMVAGDPNLPNPIAHQELDKPSLRTASISNKQVVIAEVATEVDGHKIIVQLAETTKLRKWFKQVVLLCVAGPQLLLIAVGMSAVWYGVARILTPLRVLQEQLSSRTPLDLSQVPDDGVPEEVVPLVGAINKLLARLGEEIKAHQRFISNAAHQLRTPLAGLKTYSSLGTELSEVQDLRHVISELDQGIDRANRMVAQLLALARVDAVDQTVNQRKTHLDLNSIVSDVTSELISRAISKGIELTHEIESESAIVYGDDFMLRHLVTNLVENAIAYTGVGGRIVVRVTGQTRPCLSVMDNGVGIPECERDKIFERFYRVVGTTGDGSGLGLSIVKEVANGHGARVSVMDGHGGKGTHITVEFVPEKLTEGKPFASSNSR